MKICACGCGKEVKGRGIYYHGHRPEDTFAARGLTCGCGCGNPLPSGRQARYYAAKFIVGHNQRISPPRHVYTPVPEEIPSGICECGCGGETPICTVTNRSLRWFRGHPRPFKPGHHARINVRSGLVNRTRTLSPTEAAYFAGILDGEGTIMVYPRWVKVSIANTDEALIAWLGAFGGGINSIPLIENRRQQFRWQIGNRADCLWLLRQLFPYLIVKRQRAENALAVLDALPIKD